jgi:peptidoglycan/xylan/chitin deacetylase (PgdA/CDA1 family)
MIAAWLLLAPALSFASGDGFFISGESLKRPLNETLEDVERAHRLGATHFSIPVFLCEKDKTSSSIERCPWNDERKVERLAAELNTRGFTFTLFPFLTSRDNTWRGQLEPSDFGKWSSSYLDRLDETARLADKLGASEFLVASEMSSLYLTHAEFWRGALERYRKRLPGRPVFLVANWDQAEKIPFWDASDYVGISAYFRLSDSLDAEVSSASLRAHWKPWTERLLELSARVHKPLYVNELGYLSRKGAAFEPWGHEPPLPLDLELQAELFRAFKDAWSGREKEIVRVLIWALSTPADPAHDLGYSVLGKPAEAAVAELFASRRPERTRPLDVLFTLDDLPMWFVTDVEERLAQYRLLRETLSRHHVPAVLFVNASGIRDPREWQELRRWKDEGAVFGNHTFSHLPRSTASESAFMIDVDSDTKALDANLPGWERPERWFRYPNLDEGPDAAARAATCGKLASRGFRILPVTFDSRDWAAAPKYQPVSARSLEARPDGGTPARIVAADELRTIEAKLAETVKRRDLGGAQPAVFLIHSTRLTRDYLDSILTRLELEGVRWAAPSPGLAQACPGR